MSARNLAALAFSIKAAISAVVAYYAFGLFNLPGIIWAPVSAVIVIQTDLNPSFKASLLRVAANLIGGFVGACTSVIIGQTTLALAIGVLLTGMACHLARLDEALRPAYAATVIVVLGAGSSAWFGSLDRLLGVTIGCVSTLVVTFLFDRIVGKSFTTAENARQDPHPGGE
jgi:uncharacterized membrane protein YgaE (UPF0421/DUF939 family)